MEEQIVQKKLGRPPTKRPECSSQAAQNELDKVQEQFDKFDESVQSLTMDRMSAIPKREEEEQTKLSSQELSKAPEIYLKPIKSIGRREPFNEKFRESWEYDKKFVNVICENKEMIGEDIELWTGPYPGVPLEFWKVPTNKPIWIPRYLAEQIKRKYYHRLTMEPPRSRGRYSEEGTYYGDMVAETTIERLSCRLAPTSRQISMKQRFF